MVNGTRRCQQLCKESDVPFSSRSYMAEWPNLECVRLLSLCPFGDPAKPRVFGWLIIALTTRSKPTRLYGVQSSANPSELEGVQVTTKDPSSGLSKSLQR